ncbi:unnamed protein product [Agarophyton chilense]|eukprot:gb/GEZJ01001834.1/.p1 GENE.gb/GEZJ01001834.1/~~gb/GEZJ01001834.1/.p1  ORF type:complete len:550 (-),score=49.26 gb/GEZJ01001834.1/:66-1514(-)
MALVASAFASLRDVAIAYDQALTPAPLLKGVHVLADIAAASAAEIRLFLCLLLAYPVALSWRALPPGPSGLFRHVFSVVVGGWMLQFANGYQAVLNLSSCLFCYLLMHLLGPRSAKTVSVVAMLILAAGHLYRQATDYLGWTLDWTLVAMVTTQKIMGLAYNVQDGVDPDATPKQKLRSVSKIPSLLEFLSFILFPANVVIGPAFEYSDYVAFATGNNVAPPPYLPGLWRLFQGLFFFVSHTAIALKFPCAAMLSDKNFFKTGTFLSRYAAIEVGLLAVRFKYYFGWKIAEGSACMSGLGFNGFDKATGTEKWDRVENVNVLQYETSGSLRTSSQNWNKTTNLWLRRYVYDRAPPSVNLYFTYLVSAFWHGFYPGYYMFFLSVAAATVVHRQVRRTIRPRFLMADRETPGPLMPLYSTISFLATHATLNYFIISFVLLASNLSIDAFRGLGFYGHWILLFSLILFNTGLTTPPAKKPASKIQ